MKRYIMECCVTSNKETGNKRYYLKRGGDFERIGKDKYDEVYIMSDGIDTLYTVNSKTHKRDYKTFSFYFDTKNI